jgi:ABC-type Zn2+ transport system substrate-binding protein/surface adhesin
MKSNGYINATKLCTEGGKEFRQWKRLKTSIELINLIEFEGSGNSHPPLKEVNNGDLITSGTYLHQDLIPHICMWISPEFALKVSKIVNQYLINEFKQQIDEKDEIINQSNDTIAVKSENYVPLLRNTKDPVFVVNRTAENTFNFKCTQKRSYKRHPDEILYLETPNAKNILNRLKQRIPFKLFTVILSETFSEQQLIDLIHEVNDVKYD